MKPYGISRSSLTINSIWKVRGRRPTLRRTCKVYIPRDLRQMDTLHIPATYEEDSYIVHKLKAFTKHKIHHFILVFVISFYLYTGALLFQYLETQCEAEEIINITEARQNLLKDFNKTIYSNDESKWMIELEEIIELHELKVIELQNNTSVIKKSDGWSIQESIFYCFTVITTIGYGDISPCSNTGRAVTTFYAAMGVPLMFLVLADLGKLFTKAMKFLFRYFKRFYKTGTFRINTSAISENKPLQYMTVSWRTVRQDQKPKESKDDNAIPSLSSEPNNQVTTLTIHNDELYKTLDFLNPDEKNHKHVEVEDEFTLPVTLAIAMVIAYMIVGGVIFSYWEDWTFFESFYFVFISMTTIGLGDYTPQNQQYMMGAFVYLVLGLVLNSMCINVIQEKISATFQKAKVRIGNDTVLNVHALLEDEDHRSRHLKCESEDIENCLGVKMIPHKNSVCDAYSSMQTSKPYYKAVRKLSEGAIKADESKDFLKVPFQNRFKFYDSPYSTIQDDSQITVTSLKSIK